VAIAEEPGSENASSPIEVLSPGSVYRPEWGYNVNLARQVAMGSQLRLRFEQEAKLLKKSVSQTEAEMKRAAEGKNAELMRELEDIHAQFSGLKVSNEHLSQQVAALQEQVSGEEKLKAAFKEFKQYEDDRVEQR
nr:hypothetical protein [Tanacetum cinerariifolium]